jgi:hypothetical protein
MLPHLNQNVQFSENDKDELYTLCESIGDAEEWILSESLVGAELEKAQIDVAGWKAKFRSLIGVDENWEPENGDWRMGCY